jgi:hypothetical protein
MVTCKEFSNILQSLYDNNYILIDIHSIAAIDVDERGTATMDEQVLKIPEGKKPIVLSQDNLDYSGVTNGDGRGDTGVHLVRTGTLDKTKVKETFGVEVPHWYESLKQCIDRL